jgi:hypothetical protein
MLNDTRCLVFIVIALLFFTCTCTGTPSNENSTFVGRSKFKPNFNVKEMSNKIRTGAANLLKNNPNTLNNGVKNGVKNGVNKMNTNRQSRLPAKFTTQNSNTPKHNKSNFKPYGNDIDISDTKTYENYVNYGGYYEILDYNPTISDLASTEYSDSTIKDISLESEVRKSHKDYIDNVSHISTGASVQTMLDDSSRSIETTNFVGLSGAKVIKALRGTKPKDGMREVSGFNESSLDGYAPSNMDSLI